MFGHHLDPEDGGDADGKLEDADGLTREHSTFGRREVVQAFAEAASARARVRGIEAKADAFLSRDSVVEVEPVGGERRFTTREMLQIERELMKSAERRRGAGVGRASEAARDEAFEARPELSEEQRRLVASLTQSGSSVQVVRAAADTGKTRALDAAREAWQRSGVPVLGCSLSARCMRVARPGRRGCNHNRPVEVRAPPRRRTAARFGARRRRGRHGRNA